MLCSGSAAIIAMIAPAIVDGKRHAARVAAGVAKVLNSFLGFVGQVPMAGCAFFGTFLEVVVPLAG